MEKQDLTGTAPEQGRDDELQELLDGSTLHTGKKVSNLQIETLLKIIWDSAEGEYCRENRKASKLIEFVIAIEMEADGNFKNLDAAGKRIWDLFKCQFQCGYVVLQTSGHYSVLILINEGTSEKFSPATRILHIDPLGFHVRSLDLASVFFR
jgi:hypothetical protein